MSEATIESIISDRLITHESVVGANQPSIQNTTKRFFQFSETVQQSKEDVEDAKASNSPSTLLAYHQLLTEISRYEFDLQSGAVVQKTCDRELEQYGKMDAGIHKTIEETQGEIEKLKKTLQQERLRRQQKEEYETISRIINSHRPRDDLEKDIANLKAKLDSLNKDAEEVDSKVDIRQKQLHLFLSSMQELSSLWAEQESIESGGDSSNKMSSRTGDNRLPLPSNDEREEEEEEEDDDRRYHRGTEEVEEEVAEGAEVGGMEVEEDEDEDEDIVMGGEDEEGGDEGEAPEDGEILE